MNENSGLGGGLLQQTAKTLTMSSPSSHGTVGSGAKPGQIVPALENPMAPTLFRLIDKNSLFDLMDILESEKDACPVMKITDVRKYSLLTFCALKNNFLAMKIIYEHARHCNESQGQIGADQDWANMQTDKGYTAIHFASYHGDT